MQAENIERIEPRPSNSRIVCLPHVHRHGPIDGQTLGLSIFGHFRDFWIWPWIFFSICFDLRNWLQLEKLSGNLVQRLQEILGLTPIAEKSFKRGSKNKQSSIFNCPDFAKCLDMIDIEKIDYVLALSACLHLGFVHPVA